MPVLPSPLKGTCSAFSSMFSWEVPSYCLPLLSPPASLRFEITLYAHDFLQMLKNTWQALKWLSSKNYILVLCLCSIMSGGGAGLGACDGGCRIEKNLRLWGCKASGTVKILPQKCSGASWEVPVPTVVGRWWLQRTSVLSTSVIWLTGLRAVWNRSLIPFL